MVVKGLLSVQRAGTIGNKGTSKFALRKRCGIVWLIVQLTWFAAVYSSLCTAETKEDSSVTANGPSYRFGVFPYIPPLQIEAVYAPVAAEFARVLNRHVSLVTRRNFAQFRAAMNQGSFDIVYVQPFYYVELVDRLGYVPLARQSEEIVALLVVPQGQVVTIGELRGSTIAFPSEDAAVTILGKVLLRGLGLELHQEIQPSFYRNHFSCLNHVLIGDAAACIIAPIPLKLFTEQTGEDFRVLARSKGIPASVLAVSPRVPEQERGLLQRLVLSWGQTPEGRALLRQGHLSSFVAAVDADYDVVREYLALMASQR